jgi:hypothetical protein
MLCDVTPPRFGEDWIYWLDSTAIGKDLGWKPQISLKKGLLTWSRGAENICPSWLPSRKPLRSTPEIAAGYEFDEGTSIPGHG